MRVAEVEEDPSDEVIQYGRDQTERHSENGCDAAPAPAITHGHERVR